MEIIPPPHTQKRLKIYIHIRSHIQRLHPSSFAAFLQALLREQGLTVCCFCVCLCVCVSDIISRPLIEVAQVKS